MNALGAMRRIVATAVACAVVIVGVLLSRPSAAPALPIATLRISSASKDLAEEIRSLLRRATYLGSERDGMRRVAVATDATPSVWTRVADLEVRLAALTSSLTRSHGSVGAIRLAVESWAGILDRGDMPLEARKAIHDRLASLNDAAPFLTDSIGAAWLRDAHLLSAQAGFASHLQNARHLAPKDARIRSFLVTTILMERDEAVRNAAMASLVHCVWSRDVKEAMQVVAASAGAESLRRSAAGWLRVSAVKQTEER